MTLRRGTGRGFAIVEFLVAVAVVAVLCSIILPAVQHARATARRTQCLSNLRQLGLAIHSYHEVHSVFPSGNSFGYSVFTVILPYVEQSALYSQIHFGRRKDGEGPYDSTNPLTRITLPILQCPADRAPPDSAVFGRTNYAGNCGSGLVSRGMFLGFFRNIVNDSQFGGGSLASKDFSDGLSNTVAFSELIAGDGTNDRLRVTWEINPEEVDPARWKEQLAACELLPVSLGSPGDRWDRGVGWMWGNPGATLYNHAQSPNRNSCTNNGVVVTGIYTATSLHDHGVLVCLGDGAVRFVRDSVDINVWRGLGTRSGGELLGEF